jgi:hypothetical protein
MPPLPIPTLPADKPQPTYEAALCAKMPTGPPTMGLIGASACNWHSPCTALPTPQCTECIDTKTPVFTTGAVKTAATTNTAVVTAMLPHYCAAATKAATAESYCCRHHRCAAAATTDASAIAVKCHCCHHHCCHRHRFHQMLLPRLLPVPSGLCRQACAASSEQPDSWYCSTCNIHTCAAGGGGSSEAAASR